MPKNKYKKILKVDGGVEKAFPTSIIFEKVRWRYKETSNEGTLIVYFKSGLIYHFERVKPRFAEAFIHSSDQEAGTTFNKYINSQFQISKIVRTPKFTKMLETARKKDKLAKDRAKYKEKKEKANA